MTSFDSSWKPNQALHRKSVRDVGRQLGSQGGAGFGELIVPPDAARRVLSMITLGYLLFCLGCLIALAGDIGFLVIARRSGPACFWSCMLLPPVSLIFFILNLKATWKPVGISLVGLVMAGLGCQIAGMDFFEWTN
ncbi:MAG TPA: hypothetical protein PKM73_18955 [Verrucomicrobiota bacterium]|nr:hypothetical protein [Verrucomicrobiota bacterium]